MPLMSDGDSQERNYHRNGEIERESRGYKKLVSCRLSFALVQIFLQRRASGSLVQRAYGGYFGDFELLSPPLDSFS